MERLHSRVATVVAEVGVLVALQTIFAPLASATNFGSTACGGDPRNCVSLADNAYHSWYPSGTLGNQIPGILTATREAMGDYQFFTVLDTEEHSQSGDVIIGGYDYGNNGVVAWVECRPDSATWGSHPDRRCDNQALRFNANASVAPFYNSADERHEVACHEIGHTVGLRHTSATSCMSVPPSSVYTSSHDDGQIDATY